MALNFLDRTKQISVHASLFASRGTSAHGARKLDHKFRTFSFFSFHANAAVVSVQDLVHDGESESGSARKSRLERLK